MVNGLDDDSDLMISDDEDSLQYMTDGIEYDILVRTYLQI